MRLSLHGLFLEDTGLPCTVSELTGNFVHGLAQDWTQANETCLWSLHIRLGFWQCWSIIRGFHSYWFMSGQGEHGQIKPAKYFKLWPSLFFMCCIYEWFTYTKLKSVLTNAVPIAFCKIGQSKRAHLYVPKKCAEVWIANLLDLTISYCIFHRHFCSVK